MYVTLTDEVVDILVKRNRAIHTCTPQTILSMLLIEEQSAIL